MNMKWRTAFVAAAICGLLVFGPSFKNDNQQNNIHRKLLETEYEYDHNSNYLTWYLLSVFDP